MCVPHADVLHACICSSAYVCVVYDVCFVCVMFVYSLEYTERGRYLEKDGYIARGNLSSITSERKQTIT